MANAFDMFKRMQKLIVPDYSDYISLSNGEQFTCPSDGYIFARLTSPTRGVSGVATLNIAINGVSNINMAADSNSVGHLFIPVAEGDKIIYKQTNASSHFVRFFAVREN